MKKLAIGLLAATLLAGCVNLPRGKQSYELEDGGHSKCIRMASATNLLIDTLTPSVFYNGINLAFGKEAGSRSYYQYAQWTDRPANRMALLVRDRLREACLYRQVGFTGEGLTGDYQLALRLADLYHDTANSPGQAVVELDVQLIKRDTGRLVGQKAFRVTAPVPSYDAKGAVAGSNQAVTQLLDELVGWLAQQPRS